MAAKLLDKSPMAAIKAAVLKSPNKQQQRSRRTGISLPRSTGAAAAAASVSQHRSSNDSSSSSDDEADEGLPLMTSKDQQQQHHHVRRVTAVPTASKLAAVTKEARSMSASNVSKMGTTADPLGTGGSQSSITSPTGSSTSSLDSPLDSTTDNEVYKTVIPKEDTSRRESSLAFMLSRAMAGVTPSNPTESSSPPQEAIGLLVTNKPDSSNSTTDPEAPPVDS